MKDIIYTALSDTHPNDIKKIESKKDGWLKYWFEILQSSVNYQLHLIIYIKTAMLTILLLK